MKIFLQRKSRGEWTRAGLAWLVVLALALPGFGLAGGICCGADSARSADCCASPMNGRAMPSMDASQMASTRARLVAADGFVAADAAKCPALPAGEVPAFAIRGDGLFGSRQLPEERVSSAAFAPKPPLAPRTAGAPASRLFETPFSEHAVLDRLSVPLRI